MDKNIRAMIVGRPIDSCIVASYYADRQFKEKVFYTQTRKEIKEALGYRADTNWNSGLDSTVGEWSISARNGLLYLILTKQEYPERLAKQLLAELAQLIELQGLEVINKCIHEAYSTILSGELKALAVKFEDPKGLDKLQGLNADIMQVQQIASASIQQVLRNVAAADQLSSKTHLMADNARLFHGDAKQLERGMYRKKMMLYGVIACLIISAILMVVIMVLT